LTFLVLFAGIRSPYVDRDYGNYLPWFHDIAHGDANSSEWLRDPSFSLISRVVSAMGWPYPAVTLIFAVLSLVLKWYFATMVVTNRWLTLFFYLLFCHFYILCDLSEIRAAVAIPLMAISIFLACKGRRRMALLVYMAAVAFHFSILLALPVLILLIAGVEFRSRLWVIALVPLAFVILANLSGILASIGNLYRVSEYLTPSAAQDELTLKTPYFAVLLLPVFVGVFVVWKRLSLHYRVAVFGTGYGLFFFVIFISNTVLATRCKDVFEIYAFLLFVAFMQLLRGNKRLIYLAVLVVMGFSLFFKDVSLVNRYSVVDPYTDYGSIIWSVPMNPPTVEQLVTYHKSGYSKECTEVTLQGI
jgi:hypothetical protein